MPRHRAFVKKYQAVSVMQNLLPDTTAFLAAFAGSDSLIYFIDPADRFLGANEHFYQCLDCKADDLAPVDDWRSLLSWRLSGGRGWEGGGSGLLGRVLVTMLADFGKVVWQHLPWSDAGGEIRAVLCIGSRLAGEPVENEGAEEAWELTFNAISDIITIQDEDMRIIRCNKAASEQLGLGREEIIGRHCYEIFRGGSGPCPMCPEVKTIRTRQPHFGEIEHKNLKRRYMISSFPMTRDNGEFVGIIHVARDITARKSLETQLRQAQKMEAIGALAGGIAHDFNNILGAILGYTELVMIDAGTAAMRENLAEIRTAGLRAKELVAQILSFSRQGESVRKPLILAPLVKETIKLLRATLPATLVIEQEMKCASGRIMADPTQLHQVVMNLCTNAYHAMRGRPDQRLKISITGEDIDSPLLGGIDNIAPGRYLVLSVADNGVGMEDYVLERAFEPFYTTKSKGEGTGMGLAVVHGIISSYGGGILVDSTPGQGTTVKVYFPRIDQPGETGGVEDVVTMPARGEGRILLVDDEDSLAQMGKRMLEYLGYQVEVRTSSVEALELFRSRPDDFDLLLTDQTMPNMTGLELSRRVMEIKPGLPVIICTGFSEALTEEVAARADIKRLLQKPLVIHELGEAVAAVLAEKDRCRIE